MALLAKVNVTPFLPSNDTVPMTAVCPALITRLVAVTGPRSLSVSTLTTVSVSGDIERFPFVGVTTIFAVSATGQALLAAVVAEAWSIVDVPVEDFPFGQTTSFEYVITVTGIVTVFVELPPPQAERVRASVIAIRIIFMTLPFLPVTALVYLISGN